MSKLAEVEASLLAETGKYAEMKRTLSLKVETFDAWRQNEAASHAREVARFDDRRQAAEDEQQRCQQFVARERAELERQRQSQEVLRCQLDELQMLEDQRIQVRIQKLDAHGRELAQQQSLQEQKEKLQLYDRAQIKQQRQLDQQEHQREQKRLHAAQRRVEHVYERQRIVALSNVFLINRAREGERTALRRARNLAWWAWRRFISSEHERIIRVQREQEAARMQKEMEQRRRHQEELHQRVEQQAALNEQREVLQRQQLEQQERQRLLDCQEQQRAHKQRQRSCIASLVAIRRARTQHQRTLYHARYFAWRSWRALVVAGRERERVVKLTNAASAVANAKAAVAGIGVREPMVTALSEAASPFSRFRTDAVGAAGDDGNIIAEAGTSSGQGSRHDRAEDGNKIDSCVEHRSPMTGRASPGGSSARVQQQSAAAASFPLPHSHAACSSSPPARTLSMVAERGLDQSQTGGQGHRHTAQQLGIDLVDVHGTNFAPSRNNAQSRTPSPGGDLRLPDFGPEHGVDPADAQATHNSPTLLVGSAADLQSRPPAVVPADSPTPQTPVSRSPAELMGIHSASLSVLEQRRGAMDRLKHTYTERCSKLQVAHEAELQSYVAQIAELEKRVAAQDRAIAAANGNLEAARREVTERNAQLAENAQLLEDCDTNIAESERVLRDREQNMRQLVTERDAKSAHDRRVFAVRLFVHAAGRVFVHKRTQRRLNSAWRTMTGKVMEAKLEHAQRREKVARRLLVSQLS